MSWRAGARPLHSADPRRPRIVRRQRALHAAAEAVEHVPEVARAQLEVCSRVVQLRRPEAHGRPSRAPGYAPVWGMICIRPRAPAALTAVGSNVDSCQISAATSAGSRPSSPRVRHERLARSRGGRGCARRRRAARSPSALRPVRVGAPHGGDGGAQAAAASSRSRRAWPAPAALPAQRAAARPAPRRGGR